MGYYSDYTLTVENHRDLPEDFVQILKDVSAYSQWVEEDRQTFCLYAAKWYDHQSHMDRLTNEHPTLKMELHVRGEDGQEYIIDAFDGITHLRPGEMTFEERTLF